MQDRAFRELDNQLKLTARVVAVPAALACLALVFDARDPLAWGMLLGLAVGLLNAFSLSLRVKRLAYLDRQRARGYMAQGLVMRLALAAVVVFFAGRYLEVNVFWLGAGILLVPVITTLSAAYGALLRSREEAYFYEGRGKEVKSR
ncbi:ATP synthase subunit I [Desulfovirgula thermocuniculi]|uniref:ATP synthase subunit I n=1 Tax=Desulfovirgula thermocuniculi TaxID=348842 RepID=UPI000416CED3|nr:ATP synthase subunit I [Desulfovirgula thermocuniculi]